MEENSDVLRKVLPMASVLVLAPVICAAEPFRTTTKSFAGFQECTKAMWDILQLLSGDKAVLKWNQNATKSAMLELVDDSGKRVLIRANCEEVPTGSSERARFRGFIEFP